VEWEEDMLSRGGEGRGGEIETRLFIIYLSAFGGFPVAALEGVVGCRNILEILVTSGGRLKGGGEGWKEQEKEKERPAIVRGRKTTSTVSFSRLYLPIVDKVRGEKRNPCPNWGVCSQVDRASSEAPRANINKTSPSPTSGRSLLFLFRL
jgi:hypothetical protein